MKKFAVLFLMVAVAFLVPGTALAEVLTHEEGKVEITVPDTWKKTPEGNVLTITSPDEAVAVVFMILDQTDTAKAFEAIDKELEKTIGDITWKNDGKQIEEEINGMRTEEWNGSAKDGKMFVDVLSIDTPSEKNLGIYWFTTAEAEKKYEAEITSIVKGLKPIAAAPAPAPDADAVKGGE